MAVVRGTIEQGSDLLVLIACKPTANAGHLELVFRVTLGKDQEVVDVHGHIREWQGFDVVILGRQGIAVALQTNAFAHFGTMLLHSHTGCACTMDASQIGAEAKYLNSLTHFYVLSIMGLTTRRS